MHAGAAPAWVTANVAPLMAIAPLRAVVDVLAATV
jgi:hypothetical protein